jgi:acetyl-CoA carboxylase biotin carboxyl carrier protein
MAKLEGIPFKEIEKLSKIFKENNLSELVIETEEFSIKFSSKDHYGLFTPVVGAVTPSTVVQAPTTEVQKPSVHPKPQEAKKSQQTDAFDAPNYHKVVSPIRGTYYEAPAPGAEPFVKEGQHVNAGATLCIVEAMKVMNEIKAPVTGKVVKIFKKNAEVVNQGDVLMVLEII